MKLQKRIFVLALILSLGGCSDSSDAELGRWMAEQRRQTRAKPAAVSEPKQFVPEHYRQVGVVDPFSSQKLTQALRRDPTQAGASGALIAPELARRRDALEGFPLDAMVLVGNMTMLGQPVALVKVENLLYQVRLGHYLGQNYGRVIRISATELGLREIVQDTSGGWVERATTLQLHEGSK